MLESAILGSESRRKKMANEWILQSEKKSLFVMPHQFELVLTTKEHLQNIFFMPLGHSGLTKKLQS